MKKINSFLTDVGIFSFVVAAILCVFRLFDVAVSSDVIDFFLGTFYFCAMIIFAQTKLSK